MLLRRLRTDPRRVLGETRKLTIEERSTAALQRANSVSSGSGASGPALRPAECGLRVQATRCFAARPETDGPIFHNIYYATLCCKRNIEMTPLCNIEVTLPRVLGSREVRRGGGVVDEQAGVRPS